MARFAADRFMLALEEPGLMVLVTFETRLSSRKHRGVRGMFRKGIAAIEAVLSERRRREQLPRDEVTGDNRNRQENDAENLRRHFVATHVKPFCCGVTRLAPLIPWPAG